MTALLYLIAKKSFKKIQGKKRKKGSYINFSLFSPIILSKLWTYINTTLEEKRIATIQYCHIVFLAFLSFGHWRDFYTSLSYNVHPRLGSLLLHLKRTNGFISFFSTWYKVQPSKEGGTSNERVFPLVESVVKTLEHFLKLMTVIGGLAIVGGLGA